MLSGWLVPIAIVFFIFGMPALVRMVEGRRKFLLDLKREERLIAEARAKELELEHKRRELEYREAVLELERFDRRERGLKPRLAPEPRSGPELPSDPGPRSGPDPSEPGPSSGPAGDA